MSYAKTYRSDDNVWCITHRKSFFVEKGVPASYGVVFSLLLFLMGLLRGLALDRVLGRAQLLFMRQQADGIRAASGGRGAPDGLYLGGYYELC